MLNLRSAVLGLMALGGVATAAPAAFADPITYTNYTVLNDQAVTLNDPSLGVSNETGGAGQITLTGTNTPGGTFVTWCIDIVHYLAGSGSFTAGAMPAMPSGATASQVNALISNGTPLLSTSSDASAALQVALWQLEYGSGLTVSAPANVLSLAATYLGDVNNGTWTSDPSRQVVAYSQSGNQTQIALAPVPEPRTLLMLLLPLLGLAGTTLMRRRRAPGFAGHALATVA